MKTRLALIVPLWLATAAVADEPPHPNVEAIPQVREFLADGGLGQPHPAAPAELAQFGRLVGIWDAEQEIRTRDGSWVPGSPALWTWRYTLDGFAVQDLWLHTAENLPSYLADLGRPYLLTALRVFEVASGKWKIAWAANGGGATPGADFGILTAEARDGNLVLEGESDYGKQRITFSDITPDSFTWTSEYSPNGETWQAIMRVRARRRG